ncbi:unnamed protein product [Prunus armeniaca]
MSKSDQEQSSPKPLSPRTTAVRAGLSRNYSSSSTESKSYEYEGKPWLYSLPNASIHTWDELSNKFLQKIFMAQKTNKIIKEILGFTQKEGETFHECWERYNGMSYNRGRGAPKKAVVYEQAVTGPLRNKVEVQDQSFAEHMLEQANALQARNPHNDLYSNTYNPGWRNHPNFR